VVVRISHTPAVPSEFRGKFRQNFLERFLPALKRQPGLVAGFWAEGQDGSTRSITVWASPEMMEAGGTAASATPLLPGFTPQDIPGAHHGQTVEVLEVMEHFLPGEHRG
jgi:hypothetical protein